MCSLKYHKEMAEIALQNAVDGTGPTLRDTLTYSHDSLGHCESAAKELKKHVLVVNHKCV